MVDLFRVVAGLGLFHDVDPLVEVWRVWREHVQKRDWRKNTARG